MRLQTFHRTTNATNAARRILTNDDMPGFIRQILGNTVRLGSDVKSAALCFRLPMQ